MISIVLYGRNDNYGYNLHKRAALSLNCMAEVLTDPSGRDFFVDYNTPDDFPTFPEAIQDTLTKRARDFANFACRPRIPGKIQIQNALAGPGTDCAKRSCSARVPFEPLDSLDKHRHDLCPVGRKSPVKDRAQSGAWILYAPELKSPEILWESFDEKRSDEHHKHGPGVGQHAISQRNRSWIEIHSLRWPRGFSAVVA